MCAPYLDLAQSTPPSTHEAIFQAAKRKEEEDREKPDLSPVCDRFGQLGMTVAGQQFDRVCSHCGLWVGALGRLETTRKVRGRDVRSEQGIRDNFERYRYMVVALSGGRIVTKIPMLRRILYRNLERNQGPRRGVELLGWCWRHSSFRVVRRFGLGMA